METAHRLVAGDAVGALAALKPGSVHLVVTSPPYPMVAMWDGLFAAARGDARDPWARWEAQHQLLDRVWAAAARVLVEGGFACVVVGDAVRTLDGVFRLFPNHARVLAGLRAAGLDPLPDILWRKPTNAPTKFMGSGMLPAGAYVTYEHEYVLVARKGRPRLFSGADRARRRRSAYFWEERNRWFSDLWTDLVGVDQALAVGRARSAAFPLELPFRLIQMYSLHGDVVADPYAGTGTTLLAAAATGRAAWGAEADPALVALAARTLARAPEVGAALVARRLAEHRAFVDRRRAEGKPPGHHHPGYAVPVVTAQETGLVLLRPREVRGGDGAWTTPLTDRPPGLGRRSA